MFVIVFVFLYVPSVPTLFARFYGYGQRQAFVTRFLFQPLWLQVRTCTDQLGWFSDAFALVLWLKTGGIAGCALASNMTAICSDTCVYVGVTIFALVRSCRRVDRLETTRFLQIAVASATFVCAHKRLPGFVLESNMTAYCSNTTAYAVIFPVSVRVYGKAPSGISSLHVYAISDVSRWFCIELDASSQRCARLRPVSIADKSSAAIFRR